MSYLFEPLEIRSLRFRNRIFVSPMCQYSSDDGMPRDWHLVHLGSRAVGGAALVIVEATAVAPEGRISPYDSGIWSDSHAEAFQRITAFVKSQGAAVGIQIAHAGRKASTDVPWRGGKPLSPEAGGWQPVAPSSLPFADGYAKPHELSEREIDEVVGCFAEAARRSERAGFDVVEIHMAHGYLLHEFLSPLSNRRSDRYGGDLSGRLRLPLRVAAAVRETFPANLPVFVRISSTDWVEKGWDLEQSIVFARELQRAGIDLIDCSSGGNVAGASIPIAPGYQVPFAAAIRKEAGIKTGAVGMITDPNQAEQLIARGDADAVLLGRELLRDPYWPLRAAKALGVDVSYPVQYERAK
jgi:2,4-dienoyl-CoA reductase-like NADH-dependent reductase (Old Yellow Enzyme family)